MLQRSPPIPTMLSSRLVPATAAFMGAVGVVLGALAAHTENSANLSVASSFLLFHAPAILVLTVVAPRSRLIRVAQFAMSGGAILFSGTLSMNALAGIQISPSPAPLGGTLLILAWMLAGIGFLSRPANQ